MIKKKTVGAGAVCFRKTKSRPQIKITPGSNKSTVKCHFQGEIQERPGQLTNEIRKCNSGAA